MVEGNLVAVRSEASGVWIGNLKEKIPSSDGTYALTLTDACKVHHYDREHGVYADVLAEYGPINAGGLCPEVDLAVVSDCLLVCDATQKAADRLAELGRWQPQKDPAPLPKRATEQAGASNTFEFLKGKKVVVRGNKSGVWFGTLKDVGVGNSRWHVVSLADAVNVYRWTEAAATSGLAVTGPGEGSLLRPETDFTMEDCCEILLATDVAENQFKNLGRWEGETS